LAYEHISYSQIAVCSQHYPLQPKADTEPFDINYMINVFPMVTAEIRTDWMDLGHVIRVLPTFSNLKTRYNRSDCYHTLCLQRYLGNWCCPRNTELCTGNEIIGSDIPFFQVRDWKFFY